MRVPGGKPVIALPGETPRSPLSTEGPVLVTVVAPSTANGLAVPRLSAALATAGTAAQAMPEASRIPTRRACARKGGWDMSHFPYLRAARCNVLWSSPPYWALARVGILPLGSPAHSGGVPWLCGPASRRGCPCREDCSSPVVIDGERPAP